MKCNEVRVEEGGGVLDGLGGGGWIRVRLDEASYWLEEPREERLCVEVCEDC